MVRGGGDSRLLEQIRLPARGLVGGTSLRRGIGGGLRAGSGLALLGLAGRSGLFEAGRAARVASGRRTIRGFGIAPGALGTVIPGPDSLLCPGSIVGGAS